jgi:putative transposase
VRKLKEHPGREIRGLRIKAYPTAEQGFHLLDMQRRLRRLWNWLVARASDTRSAREGWASRNGAGPRPVRPADDAGEQAWGAYKAAMREWYAEVRRVLATAKGEPGLQYRSVRDYCEHFGVKHDYQLYSHVLDDDDPPPAHLQQALFKAYQQALTATKRGASPPRRKKRDEDMMIQTGSGRCFRVGAFGHRPGMPNGRDDWLNAQIKLPGIGWISARLGPNQPLQPDEYLVEGASLVREADGWYAAIRQHVVPREVSTGSGICGIDVGLVHMFAAVGDDGATVLADNTRRGSRRGHLRTPGGYVELIAERQAAGLPVSKLQCRKARHVREVVRRELFPFTDRYELIAVEDLPSDIGQRGRPHLSFMRTIRTMLIQRYGRERVIDVDPAGTSRTCSMCGEIQPRSWSELPGRTGKCLGCGHQEHSDLNAARNVLNKCAKPLAAE